MTTHVTTAPRHTHQCSECGRPFYLCSERDCTLAPDVCQGCEADRQDDYFDRLEAQHLSRIAYTTQIIKES
jgi:hypothetical protein